MKHYAPDYYAHKAKQENFAARSVYKLQTIQAKFKIFSRLTGSAEPARILDLGAAPGSWTQYLLQTLPSHVHVVSADIAPLRAADFSRYEKRLTILEADFTDAAAQDAIANLGPFACIVSDAAPKTTGNKIVDTASSASLVEAAAAIAKRALIPGGFLVVKMFQGEGSEHVGALLKAQFASVSNCRPPAVKSASFERYVVCR